MVILHKKARHFLALKEKVVVFGRCFLFIFCLNYITNIAIISSTQTIVPIAK